MCNTFVMHPQRIPNQPYLPSNPTPQPVNLATPSQMVQAPVYYPPAQGTGNGTASQGAIQFGTSQAGNTTTAQFNPMPTLTENPHQQRSQGLQTSPPQNVSPIPSVTISVTNPPSTAEAMEMDNAIQSIIHTLEQEDLQAKASKTTIRPGAMEVDQPSNTSSKQTPQRTKGKKTANIQK
jgi:hypothetical protein